MRPGGKDPFIKLSGGRTSFILLILFINDFKRSQRKYSSVVEYFGAAVCISLPIIIQILPLSSISMHQCFHKSKLILFTYNCKYNSILSIPRNSKNPMLIKLYNALCVQTQHTVVDYVDLRQQLFQ